MQFSSILALALANTAIAAQQTSLVEQTFAVNAALGGLSASVNAYTTVDLTAALNIEQAEKDVEALLQDAIQAAKDTAKLADDESKDFLAALKSAEQEAEKVGKQISAKAQQLLQPLEKAGEDAASYLATTFKNIAASAERFAEESAKKVGTAFEKEAATLGHAFADTLKNIVSLL